MTTTLATLAGIDTLRTPEGKPIHLVSCRPPRAELAKCPCGYLMTEGPLRSFAESYLMHRSQCGAARASGRTKITYWRYA